MTAVTAYPTATHVSPHFTWLEMGVKRPLSEDKRRNMIILCSTILEPLRAHFGKPIHITSGYRDAAVQLALWKAAVVKYGGPDKARAHVAYPGNSLHEVAGAADFWVEGVTPADVAAAAAKLTKAGGIGVYESWTHVDVRKRPNAGPVRW